MTLNHKPAGAANQNSQQLAGTGRNTQLAGNYGGGSLADNESGRELDRSNGNEFRQPAGPLESDQSGGARAGRGASLQSGANTADRDGGEAAGRGRIDNGREANGEPSRQGARNAAPGSRQGGQPGSSQSAPPRGHDAQEARTELRDDVPGEEPFGGQVRPRRLLGEDAAPRDSGGRRQ